MTITTPERARDRKIFFKIVEDYPIKVQIGVRGQKISEDWISIDRFDKSADFNWDLHCLPIENNSVNCFICNAILEHVFDPTLALSEMFRCLQLGGHIWVEVPFMQYFHASPFDFYRWTVPGLRLQTEDYEEISSGIGVRTTHEVHKIINYLQEVLGEEIPQSGKKVVLKWFSKYDEVSKQPCLYSLSYYWGIKKEECSPEKKNYMDYRRRQYIAKYSKEIGYDPNKKIQLQ